MKMHIHANICTNVYVILPMFTDILYLYMWLCVIVIWLRSDSDYNKEAILTYVTYWQTFVSKINSRTSLRNFWNVIGKISGKKSSAGIHHLSVNNNEITTIPDIANTLGHTFSSNSSTQHYSDRFNAHRLLAERHQLKFNSNNNEAYNSLFHGWTQQSNQEIIWLCSWPGRRPLSDAQTSSGICSINSSSHH